MTRQHHGAGVPAMDKARQAGADLWGQAESRWDDAMIVAQDHIIMRFTGRSLAAGRLPDGAAERGRCLAPDDGYLLELYGIPVNRYRKATLFELVSELAQGHWVNVYAAVRDGAASERHLPPAGLIWQAGEEAVAIFASGIDTADARETRVVVAPGHGGDPVYYAPRAFLALCHAWDFSMIATQEAAPRRLPEMLHFDYTAGHLAAIGGIAYERFMALADNPEALAELLGCPDD